MNQKQQQPTMKNEIVKQLPDIGKAAMSRMIEQVSAFAQIEGTPLTDKEKSFASGIVLAVIKRVEENRVAWADVDVKAVIEQVKTYARLGLSIQDQELYIDMRKNGKTGKTEVNIKKQYQGIEKELIKWSSKKILRFLSDVVCEGDELETETDFETGLKKIISHKKNKDINRHDLKNITGAYKIAYVQEGDKLVQYSVEIDKDRIMRAYNASPTTEKPIWNKDTTRMVLKTTSWCLYNYILKPFVNVPVELKADWEKTNDKMNFESIEEGEVVSQEEIMVNANTGEVVDIPTVKGAEPEEVEIKPVTQPSQSAAARLF